MIPAYCITLTQTPERKKIAAEHFKRRGLKVEMFDGVHGLTWGIGTGQWFADKRDAGNWVIPPGHVGLNLSHWMLWSHLWHANVPEAIILEDDAVLGKSFQADFDAAKATLPSDWQFWYLGTVGTPERKQLNDRLSLVSGCVFGTHAYVVKRAALPILLAGMQSCQDHIDVLLTRLDLKRYASELVRQRTADGSWEGCCHQPYVAPKASKREIAVEISMELQGWCPPEKAEKIYDGIIELAGKFSEPLACVEIGVWGGMSLTPAALALRDMGRGHITGIDPYTVAAAIEGLGTEGDEGRHREAWKNGTFGEYMAARDGCLEAIRANQLGPFCGLLVTMPDCVAAGFERLHYLHIDDSHSVVTSCRNVRTWLPKLVAGGLLFLDDCCWPTVQPARDLIRKELTCREDLSDQSPGRRWEVYQRS